MSFHGLGRLILVNEFLVTRNQNILILAKQKVSVVCWEMLTIIFPREEKKDQDLFPWCKYLLIVADFKLLVVMSLGAELAKEAHSQQVGGSFGSGIPLGILK